MEDLRDALIKFRNISLELNICLESEDYERVNSLLDERGNLILCIEEIQYDKKEFVDICNELKITELDKKLNSDTVNKHKELKHNLDNISVNRTANKSYTNSLQSQAGILNKKI